MKKKEKYWLDPSAECRNCGHLMPAGANYCPSCSQRNTTGKINVFEFLKEALSNLFNIDTKFFRTLFSFAFPGKLTSEFFKGKHQSFASPIRMFFVMMLLFIAALSWSVQGYIQGEDFMGIEYARTQMEFRDSITSTKNQMDTLQLNKVERNAIDSFYNNLMRKIQLDLRDDVVLTVDDVNEIRFEKIDVIKLTPDELIEKYGIENFFLKAIIKQLLKLNKDPKALVGSIFGNLTFMFLILIPSLSWLLKLLYVRKNRYYVEHLVFLFHYHSFVFFIGSIILIGKDYFPIWLTSILGGLTVVYLILSMKKVYGQGWFKTILKFLIILLGYLVTFSICLVLISIISFLLF